ncbi:serine acetyltransferase [Candidatus Saccharibacteria bacterium]|nr:serine acetyltransferase [Candidatus Saccharibacteria bacterium]
MIKTKSDLKAYIKADFERQQMKHPVWASLTYGEHAVTRKYLETLRKLEFYQNNKKNLICKLLYAFYFLKYRKNCLKYGMYIFPNTSGPGLLLPHLGFVRIGPQTKMGANCTVLPMVLFGKKNPEIDCSITIGDNCYVSTGATILGPVKIGNNVTIGAGAVVTKDIPDNAVVGGVPAKVIKFKSFT